MRLSSPEKAISKIALFISALLHAGILLALLGVQFQQASDVSTITPLQDRSINVTLVSKLLLKNSEPLEKYSEEIADITSNELRADSETVLTGIEENEVPILIESVLSPSVDENVHQERSSKSLNSLAISPVISAESLENSISVVSNQYKVHVQNQWTSNCWQQKFENESFNCLDDPALVTAPSVIGQGIAKRVFAGLNRVTEQRNIVDELQRSNQVLEKLIDDDVAGELASTRYEINRELTAYLSGNFNDTYWMFVQASQKADPQVGFLRYLGIPNCKGGPCAFEYTDPNGTRNQEKETEKFKVNPPSLPFYEEVPDGYLNNNH